LKKKFETLQKSTKLEEKFQCQDCDFVGNSKQGRNMHMKRKHTCKIENSPNNCEICELKFENWLGKPLRKEIIEKHILSHAYKGENEVKFKCDECEFWGPNTLTIELHVKKAHCENIKCGLCDYEADGVESLEIHISTCEKYGCF
jgi:hypothetical protein